MRHSEDFKYLPNVLLLPFSRRRRWRPRPPSTPHLFKWSLYYGQVLVDERPCVCMCVCLLYGCLWVPRF